MYAKCTHSGPTSSGTSGHITISTATATKPAASAIRAADVYHQRAVKPMPTTLPIITGMSSINFVGVKMSPSMSCLPCYQNLVQWLPPLER